MTDDGERASMPGELAAAALAEHAHLRDAALVVGRCIAEARGRPADADVHLEVEARFGRRDAAGNFVADVGADAFAALLHMAESYDGWSNRPSWQETRDVFYLLRLGADEQGVVQARSTIASHAGRVVATHVVKKRLRNVDLALVSCDEAADAPACQLDARVSTSIERPVPPELLPAAVRPDRVRIKQRKRFLLGSLGVDRDVFAFDFTLAYSGASASDAEANQSAAARPTHEVEIECLRPQEYLDSCGGEESYLGLSLVLKLVDYASALNQQAAVAYVPAGPRL